MGKGFLATACIFLWSTAAIANCAIEKKDAFDALNKELRALDGDLALEARRAFGMVSAYEAFDREAPRCAHVDRLLRDMENMIDTLRE